MPGLKVLPSALADSPKTNVLSSTIFKLVEQYILIHFHLLTFYFQFNNFLQLFHY